MKNCIAVILGLLMVLGLATAANAEFTITGQFVAKYSKPIDTTGEWDLDIYKDSRMEMELRGNYAEASGHLKFRIGFNNDSGSGYFDLRTASWMHKISDRVSLGIVWDSSGDPMVYQSPICPDYQWEYRMAKASLKKGDASFVGQLKFDKFEATVLTDLTESDPMWIFSGGTYKMDRFELGFGFQYLNEEFSFQPSLTYKLNSKLKLGVEAFSGAVWPEKLMGPATEKQALGAGFAYNTDKASVFGAAYYDFDADYWAFISFEGEYKLKDNVKIYAFYYEEGSSMLMCPDDNLGLEAGVTFYFGPGKKQTLDIAYNEPKENYEFEFIIKF